MRQTTALLATAALGLTLTSCATTEGGSSGSRDTGSTLQLAFFGDIATPDPDTAYEGSELNLVNSAYEGLVAYQPGDPDATVIPALATEWTVSEDNTTYTFTLREGVTFHDGTPFDASAVQASFDRRTAVGQGPAYMVAGVQSVEAPSDHEVVVTLSAPNSAFLDYLASPFGPKMMSPTAIEANAADNGEEYFATHDAGTGPFEYGTFQKGSSYELTAYDDYWGEAPGYDTVEFEVVSSLSTLQLQIESGEIDGLIGYSDKTTFASYQKNADLQTFTFPSMQTPLLFLNPASESLGSVEVRRALLSGVDFAALTEDALGDTAEPTTEVFPVNLIPAEINQQVIPSDPGALAELAAGELAGESLTIGYASVSPSAKALSENLAARLNSAGIATETVGYPAGTYYSALEDPASGLDMTFLTGYPDTAHPDAWARIFYTPAGGLDVFGGEVEGVEPMLDEALISGDESAYGDVAAAVSGSGLWYSVASTRGTAVFGPSVTNIEDAWTPVIAGVMELKLLQPAE